MQDCIKCMMELYGEQYMTDGQRLRSCDTVTPKPQGWLIDDRRMDIESWKGVIVTVLGDFNKGKTHVLNRLTGTKLPSGINIRTEVRRLPMAQIPEHLNPPPPRVDPPTHHPKSTKFFLTERPKKKMNIPPTIFFSN